MIDITQSILALDSNAQVSVNAGDIDQITWYDNNPTNITQSQIIAKQSELQAAYDAQAYARKREAEYPPLADQQDMQFHDAIDGTTTWQDAIQAVKTKYPKPE